MWYHIQWRYEEVINSKIGLKEEDEYDFFKSHFSHHQFENKYLCNRPSKSTTTWWVNLYQHRLHHFPRLHLSPLKPFFGQHPTTASYNFMATSLKRIRLQIYKQLFILHIRKERFLWWCNKLIVELNKNIRWNNCFFYSSQMFMIFCQWALSIPIEKESCKNLHV